MRNNKRELQVQGTYTPVKFMHFYEKKPLPVMKAPFCANGLQKISRAELAQPISDRCIDRFQLIRKQMKSVLQGPNAV